VSAMPFKIWTISQKILGWLERGRRSGVRKRVFEKKSARDKRRAKRVFFDLP